MPFPMADYIIHAAGYAQPSKYLQDPIKTIKLNTTITMQLLEKMNPGGKFLYVSSAAVYENYNPDHPRACYAESKRCGEVICSSYGSKIARVSLAYGPGTKPGDTRVMNQFIQQAIVSGKIEPLDSGDAIRTYCYISDTVEMLWNILLFGAGVYNVAGNSKTTIGELAEKIGDYMHVPVMYPGKGQEMPGAPQEECIDIEKYETEFGKKDFVSLDEGLRRTIEYQKELYK